METCRVNDCNEIVHGHGLCAVHYWRRKTREMTGMALCGYCAREFELTRNQGNYAEVYCSTLCFQTAQRRLGEAKQLAKPRPPVKTVACRLCGKTFETPTKQVKYCSDSCRAARVRKPQKWLANYIPKPQRRKLCVICKGDFYSAYDSAKTCGDKCRKVLDRLRSSEAKHRRRVRIANGQDFDAIEIFDRDAWICKLCGEPLDRMAASGRAPLAPTLDHVTPISRGGKHTRQNVQAAHLRCNLAKGDRIDYYNRCSEVA
jgi:5-methylcytosine-specific restriction endonuclease McrA